jgi:hypothetical protein
MDSILQDPFCLTLIIIISLIPALYIIGCILYGLLIVLNGLLFLLSKITNPYLIKKIKANPEMTDFYIKTYWAKDYLNDKFYKKYASPRKKFKVELKEAIAKTTKTDIIALDTYEQLSSEYFKIIKKLDETEKQRRAQQAEADKLRQAQQAEAREAQRQQEQNQKLEVLANKAAQALDNIWD